MSHLQRTSRGIQLKSYLKQQPTDTDSDDTPAVLLTESATFQFTHPTVPEPVVVPDEAIEAQAANAQGGPGGPGSVVAVTSGGLTINLIFDAAAMAAPASFRSGIQMAAAILSASISDKIAINLNIDYSGTGGGAAAGPDNGLWESYSSVRADLINNAAPGDTTFNALPTGSTIQGQSNVAVWNAQLKLWGLLGANDTTTDDGSATFATDINPNLLVGVALHELTHAMGRVPYGPQPDIFDFFRFTSPGTRLFTGGATASAAYFSLDGGNSKLADYGQTSDSSDLLNSGVQGPNDPFNEFYSGNTWQQLTTVDYTQLDALGFHVATPVLIQTDKMTSLVQIGVSYFVESTANGAGPELRYGGTALTAGEFGSIAPVGAVQTSTGYDIAWHIPGTNQFTFWTTDSSGNYTSNVVGLVSGSSFTVESLETTFGQDLNGDGTIGVTSSLIQTAGSTSLLQIADNYYVYTNWSGPELKYGGAPVTVGEFGSIAPIGAIQTSSGYEIVWKIPGVNEFTFWAVDNNGNYGGNLTGLVPGTNFAVELAETSFGRDLNGDGTIGVTSSLVQTDGSTSLLQIADNYYMYVAGSGPELKYGGAPVTVGEFGNIAPIGAVQTGSGYEVAWKIPGTSQFTFWTTDSNGNYTSNISGLISGASTTVESLETTFHQDLNGDGVIGIPTTTSPAAIQAAAAPGQTTFDGATLTLDQPSTFSGQLVGFTGDGTLTGSDQIDLHGLSYNLAHFNFDSSSGKLSASDGSSTASLQFIGHYSQDSFHFADDGSGGTLVIAATAPGQNEGAMEVSNFAAHDTFVFAPNFGQLTLPNFTPATDTIQFSKSAFTDVNAVIAATHDDASGNAIIVDSAHDTITLLHVTTAQLLAHQSDFHVV
jgi:serralysin